MKNKKLTLLWILSLLIVFLGSGIAALFHSSGGSVHISRISFDADHGTLSGLLYLPKDASKDHPKPAVIVTHGYLNSAEMQDANAIELSRRGFVVLALDQYDHGHSDLDESNYADDSFGSLWAPFWVNSMNDAVTYMYSQDYVLKDADGNGVLGLAGHSMGGFSTSMALAMDEMQFAGSGYRRVMAGLTEGSDFSYTQLAQVDAKTAASLGGGRTMGKVAARYDEFFFNQDPNAGGTVVRKDYVATDDAKTWLEQDSPKAETWYNTSDGGKRIIYEPAQTHPWNHFSKATTARAIDFFETAFKDYKDELNFTAPSSQIWQFKELFECVALVGFILFLIFGAMLLVDLPFFSRTKTELPAPLAAATGKSRGLGILITIIAILMPGLFFAPLVDGGAGSKGANVLMVIGIVGAALGLVFLVLRKSLGRSVKISGCLAIVTGALLAVICRLPLYENNFRVWSAPGVNGIAYWTIACALIAALIMSLVYLTLKAPDGVGGSAYGLTFRPMVIISGLVGALVVVIAGYVLLAVIDLIFKTDFRIWTFAFKTFDANIIPAILRYLPTFLLFYLISTASIMINTHTERKKGIRGYCLAIVLNCGGIILWLIRQYGLLFATGVSAHPASALSGIELVAMVPTLAMAAIISRALYKKVGNIWLPGFLNGILVTTMCLANTTVWFK